MSGGSLINSRMSQREPLSRLTEREKVCLRQWLQHKSAKEIAADLGISHHAVEKRLKMARTKLGATSSLEAARMLVATEGYGQVVPQPSDLAYKALPLQSGFTRKTVFGVAVMILAAAIILALLLQPEVLSQAGDNQPVSPTEQVYAQGSEPAAGTEAALRRLVAGLASGSPDYDVLTPRLAKDVRRDLPMTHRLFSSLGDLKSATFLGRGARGDDVYNLVFANGRVLMSAALDAEGKMMGGILEPVATKGERTAGTEAALRSLVAGLASGSPDYDKLSPQFAETVRRDLPRTQPLFSSMGQLRSVTYRARGALGDDVYELVFEKGSVRMSAALDATGRMMGGTLQPVNSPRR
jgi:DNA-binding CsgD family transcriptional regulator